MAQVEQLLYWLRRQSDCGLAFLVLCPVVTSMRIMLRKSIDRASLGWNEILLLVALVTIMGIGALSIGRWNHFLVQCASRKLRRKLFL